MKTELQVPSDFKFLNIVEEWLLGVLKVELGDSVDWTKQSNRIRLVLVEAYSNVVRHAHRNQPHLPISFQLELNGHNVTLEIWDNGNGYDVSAYSEPTPEKLQEGGYGWLIMNKLMDNVEYLLEIDGKNCLKLEVTLPTSNL